MTTMLALMPPVAALGYSLLYVFFGGGLLGAIVLFVLESKLRP